MINPEVLGRSDEIRRAFAGAKPFRYVVIDNFLRSEVAEAMLREFPSHRDPSTLLNEFGDPNPKSAISDVRSLADVFVQLDDYIQSAPFLSFMSDVTGIDELRYDPQYYGGGTHENFHGAGLDAHYDFNILPVTGQHRRLNAIVYLNKEWDPAWGGSIRFHTDPWDLAGDEVTAIPIAFNRCVIFETTERSWHSVDVVNLPPDRRNLSRKSFAIYLYTDDRPAEELAPEHGTVYVQGGLPSRIVAGHTLDQADVDELEANLTRRHSYLRQMYKREYQFSATIEELKRQLQLSPLERDPVEELHTAWQAVRAELGAAPQRARSSVRGRSKAPNTALFDKRWIEAQRPGLKVPSVDEFLAGDRFREVDPHPLFNARFYLERNPDVAAAGVSPLKHYLLHGWQEGRDPHPLFANDWYLYRNPQVLAERQVPLEHYVRTGWRDGRWPHPRFDPQEYLVKNPDVKAAGVDPLTHFVQMNAQQCQTS